MSSESSGANPKAWMDFLSQYLEQEIRELASSTALARATQEKKKRALPPRDQEASSDDPMLTFANAERALSLEEPFQLPQGIKRLAPGNDGDNDTQTDEDEHAPLSETHYRGVNKLANSRYQARIGWNSKCWYLGTFPTAEDAAKAYDVAADFVSRKRSKWNFPQADYSSHKLAVPPPPWVQEELSKRSSESTDVAVQSPAHKAE